MRLARHATVRVPVVLALALVSLSTFDADAKKPAGGGPAIERNYPVTTDATMVPGATLFRPQNLGVLPKFPLIVTGITANCSQKSDETSATSAAASYHTPLARSGFLVLTVGKIDPTSTPLPVPVPQPVEAAIGAEPTDPRENAVIWREALDKALQVNNDRRSPYYRKIDLNKIGTWGISCGGIDGAQWAAGDPRVRSLYLYTSCTGFTSVLTQEAAREQLAKINGAVAWIVGNAAELSNNCGNLEYSTLAPPTMPAFLAEYAAGDHVGMGATLDATILVNWFDVSLNRHPSAATYLFEQPFGPCADDPACLWKTAHRGWGNLQQQ